MFNGYKTYIIAGALAVVAALEYLQLITPDLATTLKTALIGGGFAFLRAGVSKS